MKKLLFFILLISAGCGLKTSDKIDSEAVNKEIEAREIKRIKEGEIMESAFNYGKKISDFLSPNITAELSSCDKNVKSMITTEDSALVLNASIACILSSNAGEKETMVWKAYEYNLNQGLTLEDNLQKLGGDELLYSHPLVIEDSVKKLAVLRIVLSKREVIRKF